VDTGEPAENNSLSNVHLFRSRQKAAFHSNHEIQRSRQGNTTPARKQPLITLEGKETKERNI